MRLLRQPRLALLYSGAALNAIGSWAALVALWGFAAYRFHSGPGQVALIGLAWTAPGALLSMVSGWPIDRFGPKATLLASNLVGMASALAMAASDTYGALLALAAVAGAVEAFGRPAAMSLPPRLVDDADLLAANSLMGMSEQSAIVFGPLVASAAISLWGLRSAFLVDAATFVAGTAALLPLRLRPVPPSHEAAPAPNDVLAGLRLAWRLPTVRRTLTVALAVFCSWGAFFVLEPLYVRDVLHRSAATFGFLQTAFGVGLIGMTAILPRIGERTVSLRGLAVSAVGSGAAASLYVGTSYLAVAAVGVFLWGVVTALFMPPMQTLLQRATPVEAHGRVMATSGAANGLAGMVAIPLTGLAVGAFGIAATGGLIGAVMVVAGIRAWTWGRATPPPAPVQAEANSLSSAAASAG